MQTDAEKTRRLRATQIVLLLGALGTLGLLYALTCATTVQGADNGEFCTLFATGGVAHPSGYPLYTLLLRAFSWLPVATPAHGAALVTAGIGLAAVALLYAACRAWGAKPATAALAATVYGVSPIAWDLSTQAEVFALNAALAAAILVVAAPAGPARGRARVAWLGLLAGLGLSNHHTIVLLVPLGLFGLALGLRESRRAGSTSALGVGALLLGLSPYATLPFAARDDGITHWVWGNVATPAGLLAHFLRSDYGTTSLAIDGTRPRPLHQIGALASHLFVDLRGIPFLIGVGFLATLAVPTSRDRAHPHRWALASLAAAFLLAGPGFAALMNVRDTPEGAAIVRRFYLLPALLLCVPFALGSERLLRKVGPLVRWGLVAGALFGGAWLGLPAIAKERRPMLENYLVDTLGTAPKNAVLFGSGDERVFGFLYAKLGLKLRPDVVFVSPILLHYPWYHRRISTELGLELPEPRNGSISTVELASALFRHGRKLFLTEEGNFVLIRHFATYPVGTLIEVLPPGEAPPRPDALERMNVAVFADYHVDASVRDAGTAWTRAAREAYARPWRTLSAAFAAAGDRVGAGRNELRAALLDPKDPK